MRNDFNELVAAQIFLQVVLSGSFANAAKALGHNPSTITRAVAELEKRLGAVLLNRTTRRLYLTEAGETYSQYAKNMLAAQRDGYEAVTALNGGDPRGLLRVTMPVMIGELLVSHLSRFHTLYPNLKLELDLSDRIVPLVESGFDLAIRFGPLADSTLRVQKLAEIFCKQYASPSYLASHGTPSTPDDLQTHSCITSGLSAGPVEWRFWRGNEISKQSIHSWLHCSSMTPVMKMAEAGMGIVRLPVWMANSRQGALSPILEEWACDDPAVGGIAMSLVYVPGAATRTPLKSRVFAQFIRELVNEGAR